jgi:N-glycosidase YbiA
VTPPITRFEGEYHFLSNFYPAPISLFHGRLVAATAEHLYQALKAVKPEDMRFVLDAPTPGQAKRRGRAIEVRPDWDEMKIAVMCAAITQKFANPELAQWLKDTGDAELIEGNTWGDRFWGVCKGEGENNLGKILMAYRATL